MTMVDMSPAGPSFKRRCAINFARSKDSCRLNAPLFSANKAAPVAIAISTFKLIRATSAAAASSSSNSCQKSSPAPVTARLRSPSCFNSSAFSASFSVNNSIEMGVKRIFSMTGSAGKRENSENWIGEDASLE